MGSELCQYIGHWSLNYSNRSNSHLRWARWVHRPPSLPVPGWRAGIRYRHRTATWRWWCVWSLGRGAPHPNVHSSGAAPPRSCCAHGSRRRAELWVHWIRSRDRPLTVKCIRNIQILFVMADIMWACQNDRVRRVIVAKLAPMISRDSLQKVDYIHILAHV